MQKYKKIYVDHYDPVSGLRWFSSERVPVKRRFPLNMLPGIIMGLFAATYAVFWIYWAVTVALPALV